MNSLDYIDILIIIETSVIVCSSIFLIRGKKMTMNKKYRYYPLLCVVLVISSIFYLSSYSENQIDLLEANFNKLWSKTNNNDSLSFTLDKKDEIIDSLKKANKEFAKILQNLKKQEKIVGSRSGIISNVEHAIKTTEEKIYEIETYNEIISKNVYGEKIKMYRTSGNTSMFLFQPPKDLSKEYLDLIIKFQNEKILNEIVIYVCVVKKNKDGNFTLLFDEYYKPQRGINAFRIKNYLKEKETEVSVGYFLKSDIEKKDCPSYEKVSFSIN